jgi:3'(2'), 5'-bisphosphate nucleotidase
MRARCAPAEMDETRALLEPVVRIVREAGARILAHYGSTPSYTTKSDDSPLTQADLAAHRHIVAELASLQPALAVLSEESATVAFEERRRWRRYWLVDPLDGTREFLAGNGEFTVNVALVADGAPVLGVVGVPARGSLYSGVPGSGAWRSDASGAPRPIAAECPARRPVRVVGSRSHRGDSLDGFLARLGPHALVPVGSALKFCLVAEGAADVYPRLGPTHEWDTAAAHAVAVAAGATVCALDGAPLRYNAKADTLNPPFLCYGDPGRDWLALLAHA